jgi:hypothetical protein
VPSWSFNQSITVERWSRSIKLARMGTKSVVVMGSVNHRQANLQMIKLWPRSGLGGETRTVKHLGQSTGRAAVALASSSRLAAPAVGTQMSANRSQPAACSWAVGRIFAFGESVPVEPFRETSYHAFDELMRTNLQMLESLTVNFNAIPFGCDNKNSCVYKKFDGTKYYVGPRNWLKDSTSRFGFLTIESVMTEIVSGAFKKIGYRLTRVEVENIPSIYPVRIPVVIDPRAKRQGITKLAAEIVGSDPNADVISDMCGEMNRVMTFQGSKGRNGLEEKDI